jgi:hypothetical protein
MAWSEAEGQPLLFEQRRYTKRLNGRSARLKAEERANPHKYQKNASNDVLGRLIPTLR